MRLRTLVLLVTLAFVRIAVFGETAPAGRNFAASKPELEAVLRRLQAEVGGRLPTLDGFISKQNLPLERLQRPHYTYLVEVLGRSSGSLVRVRAHITAWFAGPTPAQSGYRELPSNGRLESDLYERLDDALTQESGASPTAPASVSSPASAALPAPSSALKPLFAAPRPGAVALPPRSESAPTENRNSASYAQGLREQASSLEEILRNQTHPTDLAVVRKAKTPVYSRPSEEADVLFLADAQDEFQVLNTNTEWVHVQISGLSRGWIRGPDLELPSRTSASAVKATAVSSGILSVPQAGPQVAPQVAPQARPSPAGQPAPEPAKQPFRLARQEVNTYPGDWAPLRGKAVRIFSLAPTGTEPTSADQKWDSARAMFQRAAVRLAAGGLGPNVEGVVLIFDSADGGMASATVTSLREWDNRRLSDEAFRSQCSFDPPEAFEK